MNFIFVSLFVFILCFRINSTKWFWSKLPVDCGFCIGFWIGMIVYTSVVFNISGNWGISECIYHGIVASLICLTYDVLILKENV